MPTSSEVSDGVLEQAATVEWEEQEEEEEEEETPATAGTWTPGTVPLHGTPELVGKPSAISAGGLKKNGSAGWKIARMTSARRAHHHLQRVKIPALVMMSYQEQAREEI